jgi:glutaminase
MIDYQSIVNEIALQAQAAKERGKVATYIPELAGVDPSKFGIHVVDIDNNKYASGEAHERFSIQSISKVLSLSQAFSILGDELWDRVGVEPSGDPFNHLSLLEMENGIPRNPLINAGALVVADVLVSHLKSPKQDFLDYVRAIAGDSSIQFDASVAHSEKSTGHRNYAAAHLLKSYKNLYNPVEEVLDFYFHQCAIAMSCAQLTQVFSIFMNKGISQNGTPFLHVNQVKRINALMLTCGFYDEAGEFAFEVGLPGKSGVGGGIVALLPNKFCIATWSPGLNSKGNSKLGLEALEAFTTKTALSIF